MKEDIEDLLVLLVYGDSLSMPRAHEKIRCDQTYAELIRQWHEARHPDRRVCLYNRAQGGTEIGVLYRAFQRDCEYFGKIGEKVLIMQCGVIDCAPRPIPWWLRNQISKLPSRVQKPISSFLHNNRTRILKLGFCWRATPPFIFKDIYRKWLRRAVKEFSRVYVFTITPASVALEKHSPGLNKSIEAYNEYIRAIVKSLKADNLHLVEVHKLLVQDPARFETVINMKDGYHLTHEGHRLFYNQIIELEKLYPPVPSDNGHGN